MMPQMPMSVERENPNQIMWATLLNNQSCDVSGALASDFLASYLAYDRGRLITARTQPEKSGTVILYIRLEIAGNKALVVQSSSDIARCFHLLSRHYYRFNRNIEPLYFHIAFGRAVYNIDNMLASVRKETSIPTVAPELWPGKCHTHEDLDVFFGRVWARYLPAGLDTQMLEKLDKKLLNAIRNFSLTEKREWPSEYKVPNKISKLQDAIEKVKKDGWDSVTPKQLTAIVRKMERDKIAIDLAPKKPEPLRGGAVGWGTPRM